MVARAISYGWIGSVRPRMQPSTAAIRTRSVSSWRTLWLTAADVCCHDCAGEECRVDSGSEADAGEAADQEWLQGVVEVVRVFAE